jgi:hypothetical protein
LGVWSFGQQDCCLKMENMELKLPQVSAQNKTDKFIFLYDIGLLLLCFCFFGVQK